MNDSATITLGKPAASSEAWLGEWVSSQTPAYCRDLAGQVLAVNVSFARKFGRSSVELSGLDVTQLIHPDDLAGFVFISRGGTPTTEAARTQRWMTPHGWRWYTWEETTVAGPDGPGTAVRSVGRDITRQRLAEELYLKLSRAVDQSPVAIIMTDPEGRVQYVNPKFIQTSGNSLEDVLDGNLPVLRDGHPTEESYQKFWATVQAGREWRGELSRRRPDGTLGWEAVQVSSLRNSAGHVTNLLCMREDITERRRLEEELRQVQKMESLGTLAGGIAHDFNNILAVVNGYADISLLHGNDPVLLQKSLKEIKRAVKRASGLVRQILTFSRKAEVDFTALDLNQLVQELVELLAETFPRTVNFGLNLEDGLAPLMADQNQLQQIVLNLCVNARDAMPAGGTISVKTTQLRGSSMANPEASRDKNYACLEIGDTGVGMSPEVRARIFEPFFTTKAVNHGTGLGLAVVYGIVASHRGFIEVVSAPGEGSTFKICLPMVEAVKVAPPVVTANDFPGGTESILAVDDEDPLRKLLQSAFTRKGYKVTCACDGLEAIDFISNPLCQIDAVMLDLNMPGASGLAVFKVIKASRPNLKVLLISGHLTRETRQEFESLGQTDFMNKPYTLDDLGRRLRKLLDGEKSPARG